MPSSRRRKAGRAKRTPPPASPMRVARAAVESPLAILDAVARDLTVGDYRAALKRVAVEKQLAALADDERVPAGSRTRAAGAAAELFTYRGFDDETKLLAEKFGGAALLAREDASARTKAALVVEPLYADRKFTEARGAAETVREACRAQKDRAGEAIAEYALARCHMREHQDTSSVFAACARAAAGFLEGVEAVGEGPDRRDQYLQWRLGLLDLLVGLTRMTAGDADISMSLSRLLQARWRLSKLGDFIAIANTDHALGTLFRSNGDSARAIGRLELARDAYGQDHQLNLSRCLTNLGRAQVDQKLWDVAGTNLDLARRAASAAKNQRQLAETYVWLSWLHQHGLDERQEWAQLAEAETYARAAIAIRIPSNTHIAGEAAIALGHCCLRGGAGGAIEAVKAFERALEGVGVRFPKVRIQALLSLALAHCAPDALDLAKAVDYHATARKELASASTRFLLDQEQRVFKKIKAFDSEVWSLTKEELLALGLKAAGKKMQAWAAQRAKGSSGREKARSLKLSPMGWIKLQQRLRQPADDAPSSGSAKK